MVKDCERSGRRIGDMTLAEIQQYSQAFGEDVQDYIKPENVILRRKTPGGASIEEVRNQMLKRKTFFVLSVTALFLFCGRAGRRGFLCLKARPFPAPIADLGGEVKVWGSFSVLFHTHAESRRFSLDQSGRLQDSKGLPEHASGVFELLKDIRLTGRARLYHSQRQTLCL